MDYKNLSMEDLLTMERATGDNEARMEISDRYWNGSGVERSVFDAIDWAEKAANEGHVLGALNAASYRIFYARVFAPEGLYEEVREYLAKASQWADQIAFLGNDDSPGKDLYNNFMGLLMMSYSELAYEEGDFDAGIAYANKAVQQYGNQSAWVFGAGCLQRQIMEENAYHRNDSEEAIRVAHNLEHLISNPPDDISQKDLALANLTMGINYQLGIGVNRNDSTAYEYISRASTLGHSGAKQLLGNYRKKFLGGYEYIG